MIHRFLTAISTSLFMITAASAADFPLEDAREILLGIMEPVDREDQTERAIVALAAAIGKSGRADIVVVLPQDLVVTHVEHALGELEGLILRDLELLLEEGRFFFSAEGAYSEADIEVEAALSGTIAIAIEAGKLRILPAVDEIGLLRVRYDDNLPKHLASAALAKVLKRAPGHLSAVLTDQIDPIPLDFDVFELDVQAELEALETVTAATGPKLEFSLTPQRPAILVAPEAVYILAQMPGNSGGAQDQPEASFDAVHAAVRSLVAELAGSDLDSGGVAVRRSAIADYLNAALPNEVPLLTASFQSVDPIGVPYDDRFELAGHANYTCVPTRNCTPAGCTSKRDCTQPHDTRNCRACIIRNPFGGCTLRGNDPVCEAAKGAQNAAYAAAKATCEAQKSAEIAACEVEQTAWKVDCERIKSEDRLLCDGKKLLEKLVAELGGVGGLSADLDVSYAGNLETTSLLFTRDLGVVANASVTARADVSGPVSFTPYDIAGHVVCMSNWRRDLTLSVTSSAVPLALSAGIRSIDAQPNFVLETRETTVRATSAPPLRTFFDQNPDLRVLCPGLNAVDLADNAIKLQTGRSAHPVLAGQFEYPLQSFELAQPIDEVVLPVGGGSVTLAPLATATSVVFALTP